MSKTGDPDLHTLELVGDVMGGCLPFYRRVYRDDDLADFIVAAGDPVDQGLDVQIIGANAIQW